MNLVTIERASKILELSVVNLHGSKLSKYSKFRHKTNGRAVMFDLDGFMKQESLRESLTEKTKLFIEYLIYIEKMSPKQIAKIVKVGSRVIYTHEFSFKFAHKFVRRFAIHRPFHLQRFDEYYNYSIAPRLKTKIKYKALK